MNRPVRVSAVQLPTIIPGISFEEKQRRNEEEITRMLAVAGERKSDIVLLGEYANLHHRTWSDDRSEYVADPIPGTLTQAVGSLARKHRMNVVFPMFGTHKGVLSSYAVIFNRQGRVQGVFQKAHPTVSEQEVGIRGGRDLTVFQLDCAKIGIMICMDIEYPEVAQVLMLRGAELLLFPHVQGTWGEVDWEIRYRARAVDTGIPVVSACYGYTEGEWMPGKMIGRSSVIGRDGLVLADMGRSIGVLTHDLDLGQPRITEFFFQGKIARSLGVTASRRPELYKDLVKAAIKKRALRLVEHGAKGK
jgi:predicted amidohydrolase